MPNCPEDKCTTCPAKDQCDRAKQAIAMAAALHQAMFPNATIDESIQTATEHFFAFMEERAKQWKENPLDLHRLNENEMEE